MTEPFLYAEIQLQGAWHQIQDTSDETSYRASSHDCKIILRKRTAYPKTYFDIGESVVFGYGMTGSANSDWLQINISAHTLELQRDLLATLPLYYSVHSGKLYISNLYAAVLPPIKQRRMNLAFVCDTLAARDTYPWMTPVEGVRQLCGGERLTITEGQLTPSFGGTDSTPHGRQEPSSDPAQFRSKFMQRLGSLYQSILSEQSYALQVSGGLDSSSLPLSLRRISADRPVMSSVVFPSPAGDTQIPKLHALQEYTGFELRTIQLDSESSWPLSNWLSHESEPFVVSDEVTYTTSQMEHLQQLAEVGADVVVTGMGGDDVFENIVDPELHFRYGKSEAEFRRSSEIAPYLTDSFRTRYMDLTPQTYDHTASRLPLSIQNGTATNNVYIQAGVWPVSPYLDTDFYEYCQGLPAYMKENKNILRAYFQANDFPPVVYIKAKAESLGSYLNDFVRSGMFGELFKDAVTHSVTIKTGLVDAALLQQTYERALDGADEWAFALFEFLCLELNLHATFGPT